MSRSSQPNTAESDPAAIEFADIRQLVEPELDAVDRLILAELNSDVALINQIGQYIVRSGGKRLRPMLLLLAARALGYHGPHHVTLATVIEFIHTATLLHDDVVDESSLRRGRETANALWGNATTVLVGDYLYSRSFELMVGIKSLKVMDILSRTTTVIAEGEVLQLLNCNNPGTTDHEYLQVISRKTAALFGSAAQLAAVLSGASTQIEQNMAEFGLQLGTAFQIVDDALDYRADPELLGKNLGDDLAEGKPTLPLIYAIAHGTPEQAAFLRDTIEHGNRDAFAEVYAIIESTNAIAYTMQRAAVIAGNAAALLSGLPGSPYKQALAALAHLSVHRAY